jgi:hypothetical protein
VLRKTLLSVLCNFGSFLPSEVSGPRGDKGILLKTIKKMLLKCGHKRDKKAKELI